MRSRGQKDVLNVETFPRALGISSNCMVQTNYRLYGLQRNAWCLRSSSKRSGQRHMSQAVIENLVASASYVSLVPSSLAIVSHLPISEEDWLELFIVQALLWCDYLCRLYCFSAPFPITFQRLPAMFTVGCFKQKRRISLQLQPFKERRLQQCRNSRANSEIRPGVYNNM